MDRPFETPDHREGLSADLERLSQLDEQTLGRRRLLSLGALGGLAALTSACSSPGTQSTEAAGTAGFGGPGNPPPGPPPGGFGSPPPGPPPGGFGGHDGPGGPGGPPPQVDNGPVVTGTDAQGKQCIAFTQETQGPYPADGSNTARGARSNVLDASGIVRSDIRADLDGGKTASGVTLDLALRLVNVNEACAPLAGYAVYLWHCDANGQYSLYDLPERTWLRGLQVSDAQGIVRFRTILPGCYMARYPHIHFEVFSSRKVATAGKFARLTSQLAIPRATCESVYSLPAYAGSRQAWARSVDIAHDNVFGDNGAQRMTAMTPAITGDPRKGLNGEATVGLAL